MVAALRERTQGRLGVANTAYIEQLNATFRYNVSPNNKFMAFTVDYNNLFSETEQE